MKIIVAKKGVIAQTRAKYYDLIDQYKELEFRQIIASIKEQLDNKIITTEEYKSKMENAELRLRDAYAKIEEYADMFAHINQDDLDSISQRALSFLLCGKINEAIAVFEDHHLLDQLNQKVELRERSQEAISNLVPKLQEEIAYRLIAGGDENLTKINMIHKGIIQSDTTNFNFLFDYTSFLSSQNQLNEAVVWDQKAIQHSKTDANKVNALQVMGDIFYKQNNDSAYIEYLQKSLDIANALKINTPFVYKRVVTYPLNTLGNLYIDQNEFAKAEKLLMECVEIRKELYEADSSYLADYARTLNNLGEMYRISFEIGATVETSYLVIPEDK